MVFLLITLLACLASAQNTVLNLCSDAQCDQCPGPKSLEFPVYTSEGSFACYNVTGDDVRRPPAVLSPFRRTSHFFLLSRAKEGCGRAFPLSSTLSDCACEA